MSPRPGRIEKEYLPRFPEERDMSLKTSPEFVHYAKELRESLHCTSPVKRGLNQWAQFVR